MGSDLALRKAEFFQFFFSLRILLNLFPIEDHRSHAYPDDLRTISKKDIYISYAPKLGHANRTGKWSNKDKTLVDVTLSRLGSFRMNGGWFIDPARDAWFESCLLQNNIHFDLGLTRAGSAGI